MIVYKPRDSTVIASIVIAARVEQFHSLGQVATVPDIWTALDHQLSRMDRWRLHLPEPYFFLAFLADVMRPPTKWIRRIFWRLRAHIKGAYVSRRSRDFYNEHRERLWLYIEQRQPAILPDTPGFDLLDIYTSWIADYVGLATGWPNFTDRQLRIMAAACYFRSPDLTREAFEDTLNALSQTIASKP